MTYESPYRKKLKLLDLKNPIHAYIFGFIQADGSVKYNSQYKNYRVSIEIHQKDKQLLEYIKEELSCNGCVLTRKNRKTCSLFLCSKKFVENIINQGIPSGKKSSIISTPDKLSLSPDYWRGIVDADGSVGFFKNGRPFIGLTTSSRNLAESFLYFANKTLDKNLKNIDNCFTGGIYRITYYCEDAQDICRVLYYPEHQISLSRKCNTVAMICNWIRTVPRKPLWETWEIEFVKNHSVENSMAKLGRSEKAVREKLRRLGIKTNRRRPVS